MFTPRETVEALDKYIVGQDEAKRAVAIALRNRYRRSRLSPEMREEITPKNIIMVGPTGVGKTELARALSSALFSDESAMIRLDMSEYMEPHSVSKLIGSPPGYVGYGEGGQLTERVRRKPYCVILFDEIEKAHPDVFNILLQVLDDGRLTDNKGRTVNFKNTIIIMTSNMGSQLIRENFSKMTDANKAETVETTKNQVLEMLKSTIRPEFLNRIDEIIMFTPLSKSEIKEIVALQVNNARRMLAKNDIELDITDKALSLLADEGYDPEFGARPVKRVIQREILNRLSKDILAGNVTKDKSIVIDADGDQFVFRNK